MSVEFSNAYQEILLDNLVAIIKQNFIFQTQIKLSENSSKEKEELQIKLNDLIEKYNSAKFDLSQLDVYKTKAESNLSAHEEKSRIQTALNEEMKKTSSLSKTIGDLKLTIGDKDKKIADLNEYIQKLEEIVPVNKLKKVKAGKTIEKEKVSLSVFEEKNDTPKIENKIQKVLDGSTF